MPTDWLKTGFVCRYSAGMLALLAAMALPASADDAAGLRARVSAAMQSTHSFLLATTMTSGLAGTMTYVAPDRYHTVVAYGGSNYDVVIIGQSAYVSTNGGAYSPMPVPSGFVETQMQLRNVPVESLLPDTTVAGVTYGQFATTSAGPQHDQHLSCTYDKTTYRVVRCANPSVTVSFSHYDDPTNVVVVPPPPTPGPSASPAPKQP